LAGSQNIVEDTAGRYFLQRGGLTILKHGREVIWNK